ncbi:MAG: MAPEG family protein [Kordiimonadaceae bacterium]|jgi:uncharacterized MAPEG superfamily protein|nr:MAPEG family protein [Kordiimonadaceae bacterium]MBT6031904.1 MAPEG family protein [Kordiimonadaceae bacterium]
MTEELYWLILTATMTALFWLPYILNRTLVRGIMGGMANPSPDDIPQSDWAIRAQAAHINAVENLVVFAPLVIAVEILSVGNSMTANACMVYFVARLGHYAVYTAGIPVVRTLTFAVGFMAQMALALHLLGAI